MKYDQQFPLLLDATDEQRAKYEIGLDGDDIHWDEIDEDIHISSFFDTTEPDMNNPIADIFHRFPRENWTCLLLLTENLPGRRLTPTDTLSPLSELTGTKLVAAP